jgi:hypothetical protein
MDGYALGSKPLNQFILLKHNFLLHATKTWPPSGIPGHSRWQWTYGHDINWDEPKTQDIHDLFHRAAR